MKSIADLKHSRMFYLNKLLILCIMLFFMACNISCKQKISIFEIKILETAFIDSYHSLEIKEAEERYKSCEEPIYSNAKLYVCYFKKTEDNRSDNIEFLEDVDMCFVSGDSVYLGKTIVWFHDDDRIHLSDLSDLKSYHLITNKDNQIVYNDGYKNLIINTSAWKEDTISYGLLRDVITRKRMTLKYHEYYGYLEPLQKYPTP